MTENKIAVDKASTEVAVRPSGPIEGLESMSEADLEIANYALIQPTSKGEKGKGPQGFFHDSLSGRVTETVLASVLRMTPCRTLWKSRTERVPECSSYDGLKGNVYGRCGPCAWYRWAKDKEDKTCKAGYLLLCVNTEDNDSVFMTRAMGMSVKPAKRFYTDLHGKAQLAGLPAFGFLVKLEGQLHDQDDKYYTLLATVIEPLKPDQIEHYRELYLMLGRASIAEAEGTGGSTETTTVDDF